MAATAELLRQIPKLRRRASEQTRDTNEDYLLVRNVMAFAFAQKGAQDTELALERALANRALRVDRLAP